MKDKFMVLPLRLDLKPELYGGSGRPAGNRQVLCSKIAPLEKSDKED
jgi:hypothetical protein